MKPQPKATFDFSFPRILKRKTSTGITFTPKIPLPTDSEPEHLPDNLLDCLPGLVWKTDETGFYVYFNNAWLKFRGSTLEQEKGFEWMDAIHPEDLARVLSVHAEAALTHRRFVRKFRILGADQQYHWIKDYGSPIFENDVFKGYCGSAFDATEETNHESELENALSQKEMLLKESNHRIKNNLQIVYSLINLQAHEAKEESVQKFLQDCKNRIQVIVLLHQKLFTNGDGIHFTDYIRDLARMVADSYGNDHGTVELQMDLQPMTIHPDQVIPCGLIVTELLSNSFKHAFHQQDGGKIHLHFYREGNDCVLEISDGGMGIAQNAPGQTGSLGLKLVSTFIKQLGGVWKMDGSSGTKITIRFPVRTR